MWNQYNIISTFHGGKSFFFFLSDNVVAIFNIISYDPFFYLLWIGQKEDAPV